MIQEIYDYLLIRSYLMLSHDEVISLDSENDRKQQFNYFVKNISMLMQNEDMVLISKQMRTQISESIQKYRFEFIKDKEIASEINYIIGRLKDYDNMTIDRQAYLARRWYKNEYKDRMLPLKYRKIEYINALVAYDFNNDNMNDTSELEGDYTTQECSVSKLISYLSTVNLVVNRNQSNLDTEELEVVVQKLNLLQSGLKMSIDELLYMKKTISHLSKMLSSEKNKVKGYHL